MSSLELLRQLVDLHQLDLEILKHTNELERVPERQAALDAMQKDWQAEVDAFHDDWKRVRQQREEVEQQVAKLEQQLENMHQAARSAKSNREYSEYMLKVEEIRHKIRKMEDNLLDLMEKEDQAFESWKSADKEFKEKVVNLDKQREELRKYEAQLRSKLEALKKDREELFLRLPKDIRELYTYIARNRGGIAMAAVRDETCSACHIQLRPRVYQSLKLMETLVQCESCSRILYLPELIAETSSVASQR